MDLPLVSFCMTSYNQREYALMALEAAFRQDYPNMEIIVSDGASTDGSTEALIEFSKKNVQWKDRVKILTSDHNIGCTANYEKLFIAARGELVISADGDDISEPNRVSRIVEEWLKAGKKASVIFSDGWKIDGAGNVIGRIGRRSVGCPLGACMAFSPRVVLDFPAVTYSSGYQDHIFARRGILIGSVLQLEDHLIRYRVGSGVSSVLLNRRMPELRSAKGRAASFCQSIIDVEYWQGKGFIDSVRCRQLCGQFKELIDRNLTFAKLIEGRHFAERLTAYRKLYKHISVDAILRIPYLLPKSLGDFLYGIYGALGFAVRRVSYLRKVKV